MSKKSWLRSREQEETHASSNLQPLEDEQSSSDENEQEMWLSEGGRNGKKNRIPWDREARGDKNGLKTVLLSVVKEGRYHVDGKFMENFRTVSKILSQPGQPFEKYQGIEPSGAQRKFNQIVREITKLYFNEEGEIMNEHEASEFEVLALSVIKDLIEKEKAKALLRQAKTPSKQSDSDLPSENAFETPSALIGSILKKRKSEEVQVRAVLRKAAKHETAEVLLSEDAETPQLARVTLTQHEAAVKGIKAKSPEVVTVGDLLQVADVSEKGRSDFFSTTQLRADKPLDRLLKLYEEVCEDRDYVSKCMALMGLNAADALELDVFLRPYYISV